MATKSNFRPSAARPARKPAKKFSAFRHSSELALVQLVARYVPAAITVEQALPLIHKVFSVYEPAWDHEHDEEELGYHAGRLYCRLTQRELADLVLTAVPDARILFPRPLYGCPM